MNPQLTDFIVVKGIHAACKLKPFGFEWGGSNFGPPPEKLMRWDFHDGAQKFAGMNGGMVTTVQEFYYTPGHAGRVWT